MSEFYQLGVCYYPEHWPQSQWADDAADMAARGISKVRIGEFAWSRIEPARGNFQWDRLDGAIETLSAAGLKIILGTPTATPPKWLMDEYDDILAVDKDGRPRRFGSRRHYCFSSKSYVRESGRITRAVAERYGKHPALYAWQTDNEYGCHDTSRSWSPMAQAAFRLWLREKYKTVDALNTAWGGVFWSMEFQNFDQIDLPNLTVTEPNPSHVLDFYRFSSDQVIKFNRVQCDIIRARSDAPISHNFMGYYGEFDHFKLSQDLDIATWDSYPLGFLDIGPTGDFERSHYMRQGHPDFAGFHHDLYRGCKSRWWVMEQQPGPVNWADHNPAPIDGMVKTWSLEAFAHGAEGVSWFRYRQAPFAQEQFHAGLKRVDNAASQGGIEAAQTAAILETLPEAETQNAKTALVFSYEALWMSEIQPQGKARNFWRRMTDWYGAARKAGLDVDIISETKDFAGYDIVMIADLPIISPDFIDRLKQSKAQFIFGPGCGGKTKDFHIPPNLVPGNLQDVLALKVIKTETLRAGVATPGGGHIWQDYVETDLPAQFDGALFSDANIHYFTTVPGEALLQKAFAKICKTAGVETTVLPDGVRVRRRGDLTFVFNYNPHAVTLPDSLIGAMRFRSGQPELAPGETAVLTAQD